MKLKEIYSKEIERKINPAVVAQDRTTETIDIEIGEYVFTDEIINNLYKVLLAIKNKELVSKTGIWINGYYGSGKSHFLKYIHYCIAPETKDVALARLVEAVKERDPMLNGNSRIVMSNSEMADLKRWYDKAEIEDILFNAQDVSKANKDNTTFTNIFFNMFNQCRGYNAYNIPLATLFEKYLDENKVFAEFKERLFEEEEFDWDTEAADVVANELDTVLQVAKSCIPKMDIESLKLSLLHKEAYHIDTRKFTNEIANYLNSKGENYRLIFLVDEVSQFVNTNKDVLLGLQTVIESLSLNCNKQVWVACTAQQTIETVTTESGIHATDDDYGKIMGRFETRVSLESTDPAYITQKRILDKNAAAEITLKKLYQDKRDAILNQFQMGHELYKGFGSEEDFLLSYPFVPYQFKLISKVFEAFQRLEYVLAEVKDNERSVLKITHETAKINKDEEVGTFIPFDAFFNQMFWQNLIHRGTKAIEPALSLEVVKSNPFYQRVVKVLFMISNLQDSDKQLFGSTLDNLVLLMMTNLDENKLQLRNKIEEVLNKLIEANIIREENKNYYFYNEDEVELSKLIANTTLGTDFVSESLKTILFPWLRVENKIRFAGNDFRIIANIDGKNYLGNNGDVIVSFTVFDDTDRLQKSLANRADTLILCLNEWFKTDKALVTDFQWFCKVELYIKNNQIYPTEARKKSIESFKLRNVEMLESRIKPTIYRKFTQTPFISGNTVIDPSEINGDGADRYRNVLFRHLESVYKYAKLAETFPQTQEELKHRTFRPVQPNEYTELNPLNDAEKLVNDYITRHNNEILLSDLLDKFKAAPYGWKDVSIIFIVTELYKRKLRDLSYRNQPRYPLVDFVNKAMLTSERSSLAIVAMQAISQDLINRAIEAWKIIFNEHITPTGDGNALFDELRNKRIVDQHEQWKKVRTTVSKYPFASHLTELTDKLSAWENIREPQRLFESLSLESYAMANLVDVCRNLKDFAELSLDEYNNIKRFCEQNEENFIHLEASDRDKAEQLKSFLLSDSVRDFRSYLKLKTELDKAIREKVKALQNETLVRYEAIFNDLDALAEANQVGKVVFADRGYKLQSIEKLKTISLLRLELSNADNFSSKERSKILLEKNKMDQELANKEALRKRQELINKGEKPDEVAPVQSVAEPPISFSLPKADYILSTEAEVDAYLTSIRQQLMHMILSNKKIIIK